MTNDMTVFNAARNEMTEILDAGARGLKPAGRDLMPIKREMLSDIPDADCDLILETCGLLFAALLSYEAAQWTIDRADNPVELVTARMEAGRARGVVEALYFGPTRRLLAFALDRAPIAFYALAQASPDMHLLDRFNR